MNELATPNILAFAGKKQSGKDSCALFVLGIYMCELKIIKGGFCVNENGLNITDINGSSDFQGIFDPRRDNDGMKNFLEEYVHPYIKFYSFADRLKEFCVEVLGVEREKIYGTDEQKNSLTHLKWEDMPGVMSWQQAASMCGMYGVPQDINRVTEMFAERGIILNQTQMTGREVMQYFGTNIVRKMYGPAWAKETLRRIKKENTLLAVITDCRFVDEVDEVQTYSGKVVKLNRSIFQDGHSSENQFDKVGDNQFDAIIDNQNMSLDEQNEALLTVLTGWGLVPETKILG